MRCSIVALSLLLTLAAWSLVAHAIEQRNAQRFARRADAVIAQFVEQLQRHADILAAAAGLVMASDEVTREEWQRFAATLDLDGQFPALSGIGVARHVPRAELPAFLARERESRADFVVYPDEERPVHLPLVRATPEHLAPALEGRDLAADQERRVAAANAAALGIAQLTAPIRPTASGEPGVVMMVPYYADGPLVPEEQRVERFAGTVIASMLLENLAAGTLDAARRQIRVRISDGGEPLYDEIARGAADVDPAPLHTLSRDVPVHGRTWRFEVHSTLAFRRDANLGQPPLVLVGGLCIVVLVHALLSLHARGNRRLQRAADELQVESAALARSNEKLEAFARVASHDLKAPLNGIRTLVDFIEEDLRDAPGPEGVPLVAHNLVRIREQARRADVLIEGILDYSGLDDRSEVPARADTRQMLGEIAEMLDVDPGRLSLGADLPVFETYVTRLQQVLANLIGNAFKYHHDVDRAHVRVSVEGSGSRYRFVVSDDGPGIDERFHERIFEPFDSGPNGARADSTGVGLAIVRENVEAVGGTISLASAPGHGATFTFDWPRRVDVPPARASLPDGDGYVEEDVARRSRAA